MQKEQINLSNKQKDKQTDKNHDQEEQKKDTYMDQLKMIKDNMQNYKTKLDLAKYI